MLAVSKVDLTGKPAAACRYGTRVPTLGISSALREMGPVEHCWRTVFFGRREKCHGLSPNFSRYPLGRTVLSLEKTVTAASSNSTRQPWLHSGPMPIKLLWNCGMMWAAVVESEERRRLQDADEWWGGPPDVPTSTWSMLGLTFTHGALGVR